MSETTSASRATTRAPRNLILYNVLIGLCALAVFLQGLWAGLFLEHDGERDQAAGWIDVHARCGEIALVLAVLATVVALARLRSRRDLLTGSILLVVLLAVEAYLGGLIVDDSRDTLTAVHVPLALAIMALVVWLAVRARPRALQS
jgi:cytochrome c biogenesis factor